MRIYTDLLIPLWDFPSTAPIFGVPIMLNPVFFIPMVLNTLIPGLIGWAAYAIFHLTYNPTIAMPWVTPAPVTALMIGGVPLLLLVLVCIVVTSLIWYPFFKMADNQALKEEQEAVQA